MQAHTVHFLTARCMLARICHEFAEQGKAPHRHKEEQYKRPAECSLEFDWFLALLLDEVCEAQDRLDLPKEALVHELAAIIV